MNLNDITTQPFILTLFKRDDDERFLLGIGAYEFKNGQTHFSANNIINDVVEIQGSDGALVAGQVRRATSQSFDGFIGDGSSSKTDVEKYRRNFFAFFQKNHFYTAIYIFSDGSAIQRKRGYITDAPEIKELWQMFPEYHIGLNFEDVNYYKYAENSDGSEKFSNVAKISSSTATTGGLIWDEYGIVWNGIGAKWEDGGEGGQGLINVDSIVNVYPIITIVGPAYNPTITNISTGQVITFNGNIIEGQTLIINVGQKIVELNGTSVISDISGDWLYLKPGMNRIAYSIDNAEVNYAKLEWQEIVG